MSTITDEEKRRGEAIYEQAIRLMEQADDLDDEKEKERSNMMFEAYQRSKEREMNPKSQGVTVVKTLVKEMRKDKTKNDESGEKRRQAVELFEEAANEYNNPDAAIQLGNMMLKKASRSFNMKGNRDDEPDPEDLVGKAIELFRRAGNAGSRVGWYNLGHLYWTGFPPSNSSVDDDNNARIVVADMDEAMDAFKKAIELGDSDAMYLVGVHRLGEKDLKSNRIGISLIEQAAESGHDGALYYLALLVSTSWVKEVMILYVEILESLDSMIYSVNLLYSTAFKWGT